MGAFRLPWGLSGALLASTYLHSLGASGSPSINVGLKAPFPAPPYLLELLETAADENATSYFPLLDRIADGYFQRASTDKELYEKFLQVLVDDGHIADPELLSSFKFALSTRSAAPRVEAHFQYYNTAVEPSLKAEQGTSCPVWVSFNGKQYCSPTMEEARGDIDGALQDEELQFDRILGNSQAASSILYTDITSPHFGKFHKTLAETARAGKTSYRIRHKRAIDADLKPLIIPGYGVELALKRTDYIVIDDREASGSSSSESVTEAEVNFEEEVADLKPLSTSELSSLGLKAATFILQSENPFETLLKLSKDFPKYSSAIASHEVSENFVAEHNYNRQKLVPAGYNVMWVNGIQMIERNVQTLKILETLRRERKLINTVRGIGLTGPEAVELFSHTNISSAKIENEVQRFDWRDTIEGGKVIIWLNDIAKDKRYDGWPESLNAFLQRTYPGQLPHVRRECFDLVLPLDFANSEDVSLILETLIGFVKRKLAIRIGLVPLFVNEASYNQTKIVYHLVESYGLSAATTYLETSYEAQKLSTPNSALFDAAIKDRVLKPDKEVLSIAGILGDGVAADKLFLRTSEAKAWLRRLSIDNIAPIAFVDGAVVPRDENWLQTMSQRVTGDLQTIQTAIYREEVAADAWLPEQFLTNAATKRHPLVTPEDEKTIKIFDVSKLINDHGEVLEKLPRFTVDPSSKKDEWLHLLVIGDFNTQASSELLTNALTLQEKVPVDLTFVHNPAKDALDGISNNYFTHMQSSSYQPHEDTIEVIKILGSESVPLNDEQQKAANDYWHKADALVESLSLLPGQGALVLNGRLVGPLPAGSVFSYDDLFQLVEYERFKRIGPAYAAIESLGLSDMILDPVTAAKLSSIVAISATSDTPEGIFDSGPTMRMTSFDVWNTTHTTIEVGDASTASIQINVLIDPASQQGQRWVPILKVLSELEGIYVRVFINPIDELSELPVKRFYRYVLDSKPTFDESGSLSTPSAIFHGIPQEALLTVGMDIPPSWLVAPKESIYDLDNIKLSSMKGDVEALYELEHILIEGHSREIPGGGAPRGAQLALGTARDAHTADTIIMSNLGYFQFKANPGYYKIDLLKGRSADIFNIDSVGAKGWSPVPGDETHDVVLMSFQGATLYPRLSRKAGMESEDVLELKPGSKVDDIMSSGLNFAQRLLGKTKATASAVEHAEINIFSVASGHLYERMLNIMMVSVMKHTKHTVKFWFIEQFLSPSFKEFLPHIAAEYSFKYELVTFKWPHWLRAQTEKQREIWGYKILFLDVLFPLSLDKIIFVDADQIVRTDMIELVNHDLQGAPYGFTPMCDSRTEMEGFRFWKQGYWANFLRGLPYHISALYVVDLNHFRQIAAGDRLRQQYHSLSADPNSLSNLDQDLPNHMQSVLPIHSLPQEWLWCETWCSDESQSQAKTIDLCNNPMTKEPKLDRARRQVPEWTVYDNEIAAVEQKWKNGGKEGPFESEKVAETEEAVVQPNPHTKKDEL